MNFLPTIIILFYVVSFQLLVFVLVIYFTECKVKGKDNSQYCGLSTVRGVSSGSQGLSEANSEGDIDESEVGSSENEHMTHDSSEGKDEIDDDKYFLRANVEGRKSWARGCFRKAAKGCNKACVKAYKIVCRKRKCTSRAKRTLKRECRKSCQVEFEKGHRNRMDSYE